MTRWYRVIRLQMTIEEFDQLPRHPAYKYEYFDDNAVLSPRPWTRQALLDLTQEAPTTNVAAARVSIRPFCNSDWDAISNPMASAFCFVPPFASLDEATQIQAISDCLRHTREGGDGPLIEEACFVAMENGDRHAPVGAVLITLMDRQRWADDVESERGEGASSNKGINGTMLPHLTWIFVDLWHGRHGTGTALLGHSTRVLHTLGHTQLASSFLLGNEVSTLWHWRNGFRLLPSPFSRQLL